jgi:hypothetical protein
MEKPEIVPIKYSYEGNNFTHGRCTVLVNYPGYQRQETLDFEIGEEVEIYGYYYVVEASPTGGISFK